MGRSRPSRPPRQRASPTDKSAPTDAWLTAAVVMLCLGVPLAYLPGALNRFHDIKLFLMTLSLALAIARIALSGETRVPRPWTWGLGLLAAIAVSAVANGLTRVTLIGYAGRHAGLWMWLLSAASLVVAASIDAPLRRLAQRSIFAAASVTALVVLLQAIGLPVLRPDGFSGRPTGTFGSAAFSGAFLSIALVAMIAHVLQPDEKSEGGPSLAVVGQLVLLVAALVATGARAAWLGTALGLAVLLVVSGRNNRWQHQWLRRAALAVGGTASVGIVLLAAYPNARERIREGLNLRSGTVAGRLDLWRGIPDTVLARPVFGWGPDSTRLGFPERLPLDFERRYGVATIPDRAHTFLGDIAIWSGLFGAAVAVAFVAWLFIALIRRSLTQPGVRPTAERAWAFAALGVFTSYLGHLFFNFNTVELDPLVMLVVGLGLATEPVRISSHRMARLSTVATATIGIPLVLFSATGVAADWFAGRAVQAEESSDIESAQAWWGRAQALSLADPYYLEGEARLAWRAQDWSTAISVSQRAASAGDPYYREFSLDMRLAKQAGAITIEIRELDELDEAYGELLRAWPGHASLYNSRGVIAALQGDRELAISYFDTAIELLPQDLSFADNRKRAYEMPDSRPSLESAK